MADEAPFLSRFEKSTDAIKALPYYCGYCCTQTTDVGQEVSGLMTPDRKFRINPGKIRRINEETMAFHLKDLRKHPTCFANLIYNSG